MPRIKTFSIFESLRNDKFVDSEIITPLLGEEETKVTFENGKYSAKGYVSITNWNMDAFYGRGIVPTKTITKLPVHFDKIEGSFSLHNLGLKTLEGCPESVSGSFSITGNDIENLEDGPKFVGDTYSCFKNKLKSLKGCPEKVTSLYAESNLLTDLSGAPVWVERNLYLDNNKLKNCEGVPKFIGNILSVMNMPEDFSLKGLHNNIDRLLADRFSIQWNPKSRIDYLKNTSNTDLKGKRLILTFYEGNDASPEELEMLADIVNDIGVDLTKFDFPPDLKTSLKAKQMFL
jgi:hypothetical protein